MMSRAGSNELMPEPLIPPGQPINGPASIFCCDLHSFICG
ncbi:hypothetical protein PDR5_41560 [Pseudomonas sp. DR 5-09]|nr:hypothetical protein PDR5_41560 [Pseudomonas sp. DR 5-09]